MALSTSTPAARILVVDDEPDLRTLYELTLLRAGYQVQAAENLKQAWQCLQEQPFDILITDMRLPDGFGLELLQRLRVAQRSERCVVITAHGSAENAVESLKAGAFDYLTKPVAPQQLRTVIASALQDTPTAPGTNLPNAAVRISAEAANPAGQAQDALNSMAGGSDAMRRVRERIIKVAHSMAPVLVQGESGTGKELVARALHANSHRHHALLVTVNCSAIPETLLETEFFGARKGAYTGATQDRDGFFQAARGGTLFLDEIGDLPLAMQSKLLRAIQERCIRPVGTAQEEPVDVRIISATHKDLATEVQAGRFRQDLFYRLNVIDIIIPPLRERREDLPALCDALLQRIAAESGVPVPAMTPGVLAQLAQHPLQGNVRELENLLHRAMALSDGHELQIDPIAGIPAATPAAAPASAKDIPRDLQNHLDQQERDILVQTLKETGFNRTAAAARLGLSLRQIRYRMVRLNIDVPHEGSSAHDHD